MYTIKDGNTACADIAYMFSELNVIYPITPSSPMASRCDELKNQKKKNFYGEITDVIEMQSEAGVAGALHGALITGTLASTFTSSQGLLLMIPNMYKIAGEMLPCVIHVASRSLATHALSIQGDHQDIYAARQTGFCMLASSSVQEAQDMACVAHLSSIKSSAPFLHFFDGFRTSHELNKILDIDKEKLKSLIPYDKIFEFKKSALNPNNIITMGTAQNEDIYFQCTEARNKMYDNIPDIVENYMDEINEIMNTNYKPFNYYGSHSAKNIIVAMGSVTKTIKSVVEKLENVGLIEVHLYRPFSVKHLIKVLPNTVKNIAVLDRTNESGSIGEPLYLDILSALKDYNINIVGGRYGLSGKNTTPNDIYDVYKMLELNLKNNFTIGINDNLNNTNLEHYEYKNEIDCDEIKIIGYGSDGSVGASKSLIKILGKNNFAQGYFEYDSKKSGGLTVSHLRFSSNKIEAPYYLEKPKLVVITKDTYLNKYELINNIEENGEIIINTDKDDNILNRLMLNKTKEIINTRKIKVYKIDANKIANEYGINGKIGIIIEAIILEKLNIENFKEILIEDIKSKFETKGQSIVDANINTINKILLKTVIINNEINIEIDKKDILAKINCGKGNMLSTKDIVGYRTGRITGGNTFLEKRGVSLLTAHWIKENCIECGMCSIVCPHAVIRPILSSNNNIESIKDMSSSNNFSILISQKDCTGCGLCTKICPGKMGKKALELNKVSEQSKEEIEIFNNHDNNHTLPINTIKGSQYEKSLFSFSGACAGCGETPYIKLLTQLFGHKLVIANATGCSSIYGASFPSTPYSIPWANSLFEDNAEFAYGMFKSYKQKRMQIEKILERDYKDLYNKWISNPNDFKITSVIKNDLETKNFNPNLIDYVEARSVWAIGGDGWAYDIGFGGIDHILSSNENINILVLDTEVYSNTGGQSSKSTKEGAIAKFAMEGKSTQKKDLFKLAITYDNVYVASVCLKANPMQTIKAFMEAEQHDGPSIIIAYAPCIEHGIAGGLTNSIETEKLSVECGYNILMRYNNNKLYIDSSEPNFNKYEEFLSKEIRYNSIKSKEKRNTLLENQKQNAIDRYNYFKKLI